MSLDTLQHEYSQPALIQLFTIDTTPVGGGIYRYTPFTEDSSGTPANVVFDGNTFTAFPIKLDGVEHKVGDGAPSQPTLTVANVNRILQSAVIAYNDLLNCRVTRTRVFATNLDNGTDPNPSATLPTETWIITQKLSHNKNVITFKLSSELDIRSVMLPRRQVLKTDFPGVGKTRIYL